MTDAHPVIFVGGLGRSGTTLLERLLGELPGVVPLGEVVHLWARGIHADEPCGCGEAFSRCPFWGKVGNLAFGRWQASEADRLLRLRARVDRTRRVPLLAFGGAGGPGSGRRAADLGAYVSTYASVYAAAAEVADGHWVIDSSKHASLAHCLAAVEGTRERLRVVHVVRDPRAVAASWRSDVTRPEDGRPMARWAPGRTAVHWLVQNLAFELLRRRGVSVVRIRYEDLLHSPAETLRELAAELRLPRARDALLFLDDQEALLGVAHTVSGNPMRFAVGRVRFSERRPPLPLVHRLLVTALTWPLLHRYGYRVVPRPEAL
ncbi:sulfotransferase [Microtetraspora sp. NBRC 16547]|uniref:sulfotransferase n=1 Tax=Microtetraspora sp. NBRC 16547 TaxID=3030993 RepID=UPI0024A35AE2|nr:sulfotransferase [Microtetraspora sp. NBRC 16547]GLW97571.1 sulfotransferase family protein [Microtetraspora sp. NBRC 16547]